LSRGERLGLIGRNGTGKSSLLRVIAGDLELDGGERHVRDGLRVVLVEQEPTLPEAGTLRESLALRGHFERIGPEIRHTGDSMLLDEFLHRFRERGVVFAPGMEIATGKSANQIVLRDIHTADETVLDTIDAVVVAGGQRSVADLAIPLRAAGVAVRVIGDAHLPQTVEAAVLQAARLARLT